jgi:hypothetical protein
MKALTIRGVDPEVAEKLKITAREQGKSVNNLIIEFIKINLGLIKKKQFSCKYDDLDKLFGRWNDDEFNKVNHSINIQRQIDQDLWE